jgi:hypothetical protein
MTVIHLTRPPPARDKLDAATIVDKHLIQLKFTVEFAVGIVADDLDATPRGKAISTSRVTKANA